MSALSALAPTVPAPMPALASDESLFEQICRGSETAFDALVKRYHQAMIRFARIYVSATLAEEAVQEAWIAILQGCRRFQGRSSLRTWMFRVLIHRAVSHGARDGRHERFVAAHRLEREMEEPAAEGEQFYPMDHPLAGSWIVPPRSWTPEELFLSAEIVARLEAAIAALPFLQRRVITLRDIEGWSGREVCDLFEISEANQRVLLHRARASVRRSLENLLAFEEA